MLSQFKYNLQQAVSCLLIHQQSIQQLCHESIEPLVTHIKQILPPKSFAAFNGVLSSLTFLTITEFYEHINRMNEQMSESPTVQKSGKLNLFNQRKLNIKAKQLHMERQRQYLRTQEPHLKYHNRFLIKSKRINTEIQGNTLNSFSQNNITVPNLINDKDFTDLVFKQYRKVDEGNKKAKSFEQKQLFKITLNYHKIARFLDDINIRLTPDQRLKLLINVKKNSQESNYIKKQQFQRIYEQIKKTIDINQQITAQFYKKRCNQIQTKKILFSRKIQPRSLRKDSSNTKRISRIHQSQKINLKIPPLKLKVQKSMTDKNIDPNQDQIDKVQKFNHSFKKQKPALELRIDKMKININNWQNLNKIKEQNNILKNILVSGVELDMESDEDEFYLREYYKTNGVQNEAKSMKPGINHSMKTEKRFSLDSNIVLQANK